jgi:hypothetical protein
MPVINPIESAAVAGGASFGPCQAWDLSCANFPDEVEPELEATAAMIATEILWNRTKRQFGLCSVSLRPCRKDCLPAGPWIPQVGGWYDFTGSSWPFPQPALIGGAWINIACGSCFSDCSCSHISEVRLPYPVAAITEVKVDGVVLPPTAYRVDNYNLLVRIDGEEWPRCNDMNLDDTEVGTWSVTADYGQDVPELGKLAAGQLAVEIAKRCINASGCVLPSGTVPEVTRQGVKKVFFDSETAFKGGMTGMYWPDLFIKTFNPSGTGLANIFDIDGPKHRRVGTA